MYEDEVVEAIEKAKPGIERYVHIMSTFQNVNVAGEQGADFRRKFNAFYRIQRRTPDWYKQYYSSMQRWKEHEVTPTFDVVLDHLYDMLGRYEPSFSSKLVATIDPDQPVWDKYVLEYTEIEPPSYTCKQKRQLAKAAYADLQNWYKSFLSSPDGKLVLAVFDRMVPQHAAKIKNVKKVDFALWQFNRLTLVLTQKE